MYIPHLKSSESVTLLKDQWKLRLVCDDPLPTTNEGTSNEYTPLYVGKHNRPDCRLDFYHDVRYLGTLIIDFKYRPLKNIWKHDTRQQIHHSNHRKTADSMEQLISYQRDSKSSYLYGVSFEAKQLREIHRSRPVSETWAIYAEHNTSKREEIYFEDDDVRLIPFNPGDTRELLFQNMCKIIQHMDQRAKSCQIGT
jgi:hypothetical protein